MTIPKAVAQFNSHVTNCVRLCEPRIFTDPDHRLVPGPVRVALRILDVDDFMSMRPAPTQSK